MLCSNSILRYEDLPEAARYSRNHLARLIANGEYPRPVRLSANRIGWRASDIEEFLANRPAVEPGEPRHHTPEAKAKMRAAWARRRGLDAA